MYLQDVIFNLQKFWGEYGCNIVQPLDTEVGAGTSHPATMLRSLDANPWKVAYVQPCRRPADGRYADNPNRMQYYNQFQVLMKPSPADIQQKCLDSMLHLGIDNKLHDIRFIHSDWENPTLGAWGLGWEIWCDGMEIIQFTYMQQVGGVSCKLIPAEVTYGLERLAMYLQDKDSVWDLEWNKETKYRDIYRNQEIEFCHFNFEDNNTEIFLKHFADFEKISNDLISKDLVYPAYEFCLKASHVFNILEARGVLSVAERASYIARVRNLAKDCCEKYAVKFS